MQRFSTPFKTGESQLELFSRTISCTYVLRTRIFLRFLDKYKYFMCLQSLLKFILPCLISNDPRLNLSEPRRSPPYPCFALYLKTIYIHCCQISVSVVRKNFTVINFLAILYKFSSLTRLLNGKLFKLQFYKRGLTDQSEKTKRTGNYTIPLSTR